MEELRSELSEMSEIRSRRSRLSLRPVNRVVLAGKRPSGAESGLGQGMEMALTIVVFLGIGWLLDSWLDTRPIFMIVFVVFSMVGQLVRMWIDYDARMKVLERERRERAGRTSSETGSS